MTSCIFAADYCIDILRQRLEKVSLKDIITDNLEAHKCRALEPSSIDIVKKELMEGTIDALKEVLDLFKPQMKGVNRGQDSTLRELETALKSAHNLLKLAD